jgi:hypothetical protein
LKAILATLGISAVVLLSTMAPATADAPVPATVSASTEIVTAPDTVLHSESPEILTVAAPVVAPEPVAVPETVAEPATVVTPEPTASEPVASSVATEPAPATATATATPEPESYVPPAPEPNTPACMEDEPCWDCDTMGNGICGNPVCLAANLFTLDEAGTCGAVPAGLTPEQLRTDALYEFNSRNTVYEQWLLTAFEQTYIGFGSTIQPTHIIRSSTYPGVVHYFH